MRYRVIVVVPDIDPDIVSEPLEVVTVQFPVCADGLDSTLFTTT